jgi:hypothetical protein
MKVLSIFEPSSSVLLDLDPCRDPALGSVLVCNCEIDVVALAQAYSCHSKSPWCPIAVVVPPRLHIDLRVLEAFEPRPGVLVPVVSEWSDLQADPAPLRKALRRRSLPSSSMIAEYVRRRTDRSDVSASLEACLASGLKRQSISPISHRSTLGRHLRDFGPLKPRDWVAVAHIIQTLWLGSFHGAHTVDGAAFQVGIDPRTLRARLLRYCGCDYTQSRVRLGWEWIVEAALRRFGYVRGSRVQQRFFSLQSE